METFEKLTDEQLVLKVQTGDKKALNYIMEKYKKKILNKAKAMFLIGGDREDLIQEGMIGLFEATMDFKPDKKASFSTFANLCIDRQMYSAVEAANRLKHKPLNSYVSIFEEGTEEDGESFEIKNVISDDTSNPEKVVLAKENERLIKANIARLLSGFEYDVLELFLDGMDYNEIAIRMEKTPKSIDNALQRIKNKILRMNGNITN